MQLSKINKFYYNQNSTVHALKEIDLNIENVGMHIIIGSSGCGKTTLLHILSGKDKQYEGNYIVRGHIELIEQELLLFESLSVEENLKLVCTDNSKIDEYLRRFQMHQCKNQILNQLSVGQKKRIQIIRSLLVEPDYLLCDEPTAGLDHDNAEKIMDVLKEISKRICVIVVTHEIAIQDQYADYLIQMEQGRIAHQTCIHECSPLQIKNRKKQFQKWKQHFWFVLMTFKRRKKESVFMLLFASVMILSLFCTTLFQAVDVAVKTKDVWKHGSNVLISIPVKQSEGRAALFYDMFNKKDMQLIRDNVKDVIGYRWGWNFDKYSTNGSWFIPELNIDEAREYVKKAKQELEETGNTRYADYEYVANQIERIDQTYPNDDFSREYTVVSDFSKYAGFKRIQEEEGNLQYLKPYSWNFKIQDVDMELVPYQMFEGYDFEMKYGKPMKDDKEVILSCTAAEELARQLSLSSIEELVGKEYMLQLENIKKTYETGYIDYAPVMTITVSGIFYEGNENEYQVYFKEGCFDKIFESWNEINPNYLQYQYLAFLVDEEADIKKVNEQINQLLEMKDSSFIQSSYLIEKEEDYQNSMNFYVFSFFTFIGLVALYCVMKMMYRKRNEKENELLAVYNYHPFMILLLQLIMIFLLVGSILYLLLPSLCHYLNDFANSLQYMAIVKYDMSRYLISFTTALVILIMIEGVYYAIGIKKHK